MKTIKLIILFKSGVEKDYILHDCTDEGIDSVKKHLSRIIGVQSGAILDNGNIIIDAKGIDSIEIEVLQS